MSLHDGHVERLEELLTTGADITLGFERSELASCAQCRAEVEGYVTLCSELEALGEDERTFLAEARGSEVKEGRAEAALRASLQRPSRGTPTRLVPEPQSVDTQRCASGPGRPQRSGLRYRGAALVAAAAIVLLFAWIAERGKDTGLESRRLLGAEEGLLHPKGRVETFAPFRWNVPLPAGGHFVVRVEADGFERTSEWLVSQDWVPELDASEDWPREIRWTLEVYRSSDQGDIVTSLVEWAER